LAKIKKNKVYYTLACRDRDGHDNTPKIPHRWAGVEPLGMKDNEYKYRMIFQYAH
jgi:hypothetical protein